MLTIMTFKTGSDGKVRPVEDRQLKVGRRYMARMNDKMDYKAVLCVDVPILGLAFIEPGFPNFKVATSYYLECYEIGDSQ